jgi:hypothetical protein
MRHTRLDGLLQRIALSTLAQARGRTVAELQQMGVKAILQDFMLRPCDIRLECLRENQVSAPTGLALKAPDR